MTAAEFGNTMGNLLAAGVAVRLIKTGLKPVARFKKRRVYHPKLLKNMSWGQLKSVRPKMKPFGDSDRDGVPNFRDCRPLNPKKHYVSTSDPYYWAYRERGHR